LSDNQVKQATTKANQREQQANESSNNEAR
jgi:hypothetical protein